MSASNQRIEALEQTKVEIEVNPIPTESTGSKANSKLKTTKNVSIQFVDIAELPFKQVLSDEESRGLITVETYVADIEARFTPQFLKFCQKHLQAINSLQHLKRFRKLEQSSESSKVLLIAILGTSEAMSKERLQELIAQEGLSANIQPYCLDLPKFAPLNKVQFEAWKIFWPMSFRENVDRALRLTSEEVSVICNKMALLFKDIPDDSIITPQCCEKVLAIDPKTQNIIAEGVDTSEQTHHPLAHGVLNCIAKVAECEVNSRAKKPPKYLVEEETLEGQKRAYEEEQISYLCTGLDFYLTREPCVMCAMALLHSRVGRVFYRHPNLSSGALGSQYKLHTHLSLNHKFKVFMGHYGIEKA